MHGSNILKVNRIAGVKDVDTILEIAQARFIQRALINTEGAFDLWQQDMRPASTSDSWLVDIRPGKTNLEGSGRHCQGFDAPTLRQAERSCKDGYASVASFFFFFFFIIT